MNHFPGKVKNSMQPLQDQFYDRQYEFENRRVHPNFLNIPSDVQHYGDNRSKDSSEFDHNFPSSRDRPMDVGQRSKDIDSFNITNHQDPNHTMDTNDHASFGAVRMNEFTNNSLNKPSRGGRPIEMSRDQSSKCPTDEFSNLRSDLRHYLPGDSIENNIDLKFSKFDNNPNEQQAHIMI